MGKDISNFFINKTEMKPIDRNHFLQIEGVFEEFCSVFLDKIEEKLTAFFSEFSSYFESNIIFENYTYNYLHKNILDCALKTLIKEINIYKENSFNTNDIYKEFCSQLLTIEFHIYLNNKYPSLYKMIDKIIDGFFRIINFSMGKLVCDFDVLQQKFLLKELKITNINISSGDFHNDGNTTLIFTIDNKKIVYKPKNLVNDLVMHDIVNFINKQPTQKCMLNHVKTINRYDYGWQVFVNKKECKNIEEVNKYYYRIGSFLSIFLILGTEDLHNENIISSGEFPYFIDLETLIKEDRKLKNYSGLLKNFLQEVSYSVLSTMLLPTNAQYSGVGGDIGGISSFNEDSSSKIKGLQLINKGTDKISLTNKDVFLGSGENYLYLNGDIVYPNSFAVKIEEGLIDTFNILKNNIYSLQKILFKRQTSARVVFRPTYVYGSFLEASNHPKYFKSSMDRRKLFEMFKVTSDDKGELLGYQEVEALMNGDIPYFEHVERDLVCNKRYVIKDYFENNLRELIKNRLQNVKDISIDQQSYYVRLALSTLKNSHNIERINIFKDVAVASTNNYSISLKRDHILSYIESKISKRFIWDKVKESCTWMTVTQIDSKYSLNCANGLLYEGGGLLMFYLMLYKRTYKAEYLFYAEAIFKGLERMGILKQKLNESAFLGTGSHIYLGANLFLITKKERYSIFVQKKIKYLLSIEFKNLDYLNGVSGLIVLLNNINKKIQVDETKLLARKAINYLEEHIHDFQPDTGIAHGYSGIILGYLAANELLKKEIYIKKAFVLSELENQYFDNEANNWIDLRDNKSVNYGWCRGSSGIAYVRAKLKKAMQQEYNLDLTSALETTLNNMVGDRFNDDSLCHGFFGAVDNLIDIENIIGSTVNMNIIDMFNQRLNKVISNGFKYGMSNLLETSDFFMGFSGLGYLMLRIENKELPSVLHLELL